jgi:hypothetical protein
MTRPERIMMYGVVNARDIQNIIVLLRQHRGPNHGEKAMKEYKVYEETSEVDMQGFVHPIFTVILETDNFSKAVQLVRDSTVSSRFIKRRDGNIWYKTCGWTNLE